MKILVACEYSGRVREIPGYQGYIAYEDGRIFSCKYNFGYRETYRQLKPSLDKNGYLGLTLCGYNGDRRKARIHRIIAECFIPNEEGLPCVRHMDGCKTNNNAYNLSWGTYKQNEEDKKRHGTYDLRKNGKLSEIDRVNIKKMYLCGFSQEKISEKYNVSRPTITRLLNGSTWK